MWWKRRCPSRHEPGCLRGESSIQKRRQPEGWMARRERRVDQKDYDYSNADGRKTRG
jgi:hypothetical protein